MVERLYPILLDHAISDLEGSEVLKGDLVHLKRMARSVIERCRIITKETASFNGVV